MASSKRPHTPGTGAGLRGSQSESNYNSRTWNHLFFPRKWSCFSGQRASWLLFLFQYSFVLCDQVLGSDFSKGRTLHRDSEHCCCHGAAWRQLPPSPLELVWATQLKLSALGTAVHRLLSTFPLLFQILNFQTTEKKSGCSHETSAPASIQDRCFEQCSRVFCPLLLQRNQDLELLPFPSV